MADNPGDASVISQIQQALLTAASNGDTSAVARLIGGLANIDGMDDHGWTALMLGARNGHDKVVKLLLDKGCDLSLMNKAGQTALAIAKFWNHPGVSHLILQHTTKGAAETRRTDNCTSEVNFFGNNSLDRFSHKRTDKEWLREKLRDPATTFLLFSQGSPYVTLSEKGTYHVCRFQYDQVKFLLDKPEDEEPVTIFLGVGDVPSPSSNQSSSPGSASDPGSDLPAWFAIDATGIAAETIQEAQPKAELLSMSDYRNLMLITHAEAGVIGQARALFLWHDRYRFCPTCGSPIHIGEAGYKQTCKNQECRSLKGVHNTSYPRVDPVAIMAVIHPDGNQLLLGRKKQFPRNMYSCLAGFMEPGETIEDGCRREVLEESGIRVGEVTYHSSQPWPMPSQLMIGCFGYAISTAITVDTQELEDARWFERRDLAAAYQASSGTGDAGSGSGEKPKLFLPPPKTIAHQLIKAWLGMTASL